MKTKLYVGNLPFRTREEEVLHLLEAAGNVVSCHLIVDRVTSLSKGFAFVEMSSEEEAARAIAWFNGKELSGRPLKVNEARPRENGIHVGVEKAVDDGEWRADRRWRY
ncbi:MAG TPA: RNA-binding protein [Verrucomicrobiae bacterium]|nr:RNA-binding protein [Verrucomicrobiae bacterium]